MITDRTEYLRQRGLDHGPVSADHRQTHGAACAPSCGPKPSSASATTCWLRSWAHAEGIVVEDSAVHAEIDRIVATQQDQEAARRELSTNEMHDRITQQPARQERCLTA